MVDLKRYAAEGVHEKVLAYIQELERGVVLDVPSGQGAISYDLERLGFKVFSGDIAKENMIYKNQRFVQLDLNRQLPYKDRSFDYIICIEGIEHIENPYHLVREFSRLIKKEGTLVITTPNVMTIKSRWRFLFYSYLDYFRYFGTVPTEERHQIREHEHQHLNPLFYPEMKFILEKYQFQILRIETNRIVKKWRLLHPFVKQFIKYKTEKKFKKDPFFISDILLEGEDLIYIATPRTD